MKLTSLVSVVLLAVFSALSAAEPTTAVIAAACALEGRVQLLVLALR